MTFVNGRGITKRCEKRICGGEYKGGGKVVAINLLLLCFFFWFLNLTKNRNGTCVSGSTEKGCYRCCCC